MVDSMIGMLCKTERCSFMARNLKLSLLVLFVVATVFGAAWAKSAGNRVYVVAFEGQSPFYARCIPDESKGSKGTSQIMRARREGDEVITTHAWYNRNGLVLGRSPKVGKVAVMRVKQDEGLPKGKQIEFSFYLGDQFLRSYTTADLVKLGAKLERDANARERGLNSKRAAYHVEGCKQAWNTNDYYFSVRLNESHTLNFNILTGKLCRVKKDGSKQRLVPVDGSESIGNSKNAEQKNAPDKEKFVRESCGKPISTKAKLYYDYRALVTATINNKNEANLSRITDEYISKTGKKIFLITVSKLDPLGKWKVLLHKTNPGTPKLPKIHYVSSKSVHIHKGKDFVLFESNKMNGSYKDDIHIRIAIKK
jgi:hypothetical protein